MMKKKRICAAFLSASLTIMHVLGNPIAVLAKDFLEVTTFEELQNAIMIANDGDIIKIVTSKPLEATDTLAIDKELTITGGAITRQGDSTIFDVTGNLTLEDISIVGTNEKNIFTQSPVVCEGNLTLERNAKIKDFNGRRGGGIHIMDGGTVTMEPESKVANNEVHAIDRYRLKDSAVGGGIFIDSGGTLIMNGGSIDGNKATVEDIFDQVAIGGGIAIKEGGSLFMYDGEIINNSVKGCSQTAEGGGIAAGSDHLYPSFEGLGTVDRDDIVLEGGLIASNSATRGGGIYFHAGDLYLEDASITGNTARYGGGIWYCEVGYGNLGTGMLVTGNSAKRGNDIYSQNPYGMWDGYDNAFNMALPQDKRFTYYDDYTGKLKKIKDIEAFFYSYALVWQNGVEDEDLLGLIDDDDSLSFLLDREWEDMGLTIHSNLDGSDYKLRIENNTATDGGGGIACNGCLMSDDKDIPDSPPPKTTPSDATPSDIPHSTPSDATPSDATPTEPETSPSEPTEPTQPSESEPTKPTQPEIPTSPPEIPTTSIVPEEPTRLTESESESEEEPTKPFESEFETPTEPTLPTETEPTTLVEQTTSVEPEQPTVTPVEPEPTKPIVHHSSSSSDDNEPYIPAPRTPEAPVTEFIDETEVPLSAGPHFIDDTDVPLVAWQLPKTGDNSKTGLFGVLCISSLLGMALLTKRKKE